MAGRFSFPSALPVQMDPMLGKAVKIVMPEESASDSLFLFNWEPIRERLARRGLISLMQCVDDPELMREMIGNDVAVIKNVRVE